MKDIFIPPPALQNSSSPADSLVRAWQVGQILKVRAESDSDAAGTLLLRIGKLKIAARTPVPIKAGESFAAKIQSLGEVPVLKIVSPPDGPQRAIAQYLRESLPRQADFTPLMQRLQTAASGSAPMPAPIKALAQAILRQTPTADGLKNASQVKSAISGSGVLLESRLARGTAPAGIAESDLKARLLQLRNLINRQLGGAASLPATQGTAAPGLAASPSATPETARPLGASTPQQAVELFVNGRLAPETLITRLARHLPAADVSLLTRYLERLAGDSRAATPELPELLARVARFIQAQPNPQSTAESLLALLRNTLALQELQQLTDNALSRIQANQLGSANREAGPAFLLHLDLPVAHDKDVRNLQLQFERHGGNSDTPDEWNVTINFNLPELGPIQARVRLRENRLTTRFEAGRAETVSDIREALPRLQEALARTGVAIEHLSVELGETPSGGPAQPRGRHLLDEMA